MTSKSRSSFSQLRQGLGDQIMRTARVSAILRFVHRNVDANVLDSATVSDTVSKDETWVTQTQVLQ